MLITKKQRNYGILFICHFVRMRNIYDTVQSWYDLLIVLSYMLCLKIWIFLEKKTIFLWKMFSQTVWKVLFWYGLPSFRRLGSRVNETTRIHLVLCQVNTFVAEMVSNYRCCESWCIIMMQIQKVVGPKFQPKA